MKSLYRRYRPIKLQDVVGQSQVTGPLMNALEQGKISHAYLFIGPRGCGKTSVARILAHEVNGFKYELEDEYVDIIEIDGASNRGIDNIRDLRDKAMIAPTKGKYKVYIIDEVHMLTKEAFNALLKILEEPPVHVIFIMATTDAYKVPVTITSRAQSYTFKLADQATIFEYLKSVAKRENIRINDDAIKVVAKKGGGSFRDSLSLLDQITTLSQETITKSMVVEAFGLPEEEKITSLLSAYVSSDANQVTKALNDLLACGIKPETVAAEMISSILSNPTSDYLGLLSRLPDVKPPYAEARLIVALLPPEHIHHQQKTNTPAPAIAPDKTSDTPASNLQVAEPTPAKTPTKKEDVDDSFDWNDYLDKIRKLSDAVYMQLTKTKHSFSNNTLIIFPMKRIIKSILARDNNKKILAEALDDNIKIIIKDADECPDSVSGDQTLSKISDIMGGEVINDSGNSPF